MGRMASELRPVRRAVCCAAEVVWNGQILDESGKQSEQGVPVGWPQGVRSVGSLFCGKGVTTFQGRAATVQVYHYL